VYALADDSAVSPIKSELAPPGGAVIPPFSSLAIAPRVTDAEARAAIVDRVRTLFLPFRVNVVTSRPSVAPYTRILIGGTSSALMTSATEAGLAHVDCGNLWDADVAYDFSDEQTPDYGGVVGIGNTAAHEAGHAFGLEHVSAPHDVMYAVGQPTLTLPDLFKLAFGTGNYSSYGAGGRLCTSVDPIDEVNILDCNVGAPLAGGDRTPPTLSWTAPSGDLPSRFTITADATDDVGVVRVEVYKNLELWASLTQAPYSADLDASAGERFYVTVEAIDAAANRTTITRALTAAGVANNPDGGGLMPQDLASTTPNPNGTGGCSVGASGGRGGELLVFVGLLLVACAVRRRARLGAMPFA
jgi:hypothetical protein